MEQDFDVVVLGAGAAGLMCAIAAGRRGRRVVVVDHNVQAGAKILISGGGRCNFTNLGSGAGNFISGNRHFAKSALARYRPADFIELVRRHGIAFHEKTLGQLFCDGSARQIVDMLLAECAAVGVSLVLGRRITSVDHADGRFRVGTESGVLAGASLVLATGGPSIPKMGATGFAYEVARRFGLAVRAPVAALVPLTFAEPLQGFMRALSGTATEVVASIGKTRFREAMLFTHRGLSGPAILQISSYWQADVRLRLDLLPGQDAMAALVAARQARPRAGLRSVLGEMLPQRLAQALAEETPGAERPMAELANSVLQPLAVRLGGWEVTPDGTEGFAKAEVTAGGVDTDGLSSQSLMAKDVPGLFVIGEAVDVTGWLGGYNFQWAWASGWCAGQVA